MFKCFPLVSVSVCPIDACGCASMCDQCAGFLCLVTAIYVLIVFCQFGLVYVVSCVSVLWCGVGTCITVYMYVGVFIVCVLWCTGVVCVIC